MFLSGEKLIYNSIRRFLILVIASLCTSCYSVRVMSTMGAPMTEVNDRDDWYRDKMVITLDTVIKAGMTTDDLTIRVRRDRCASGRLFSVEYKNTFGGSLLYLATLGNKRKVRIKYVCMKPEN